jgi:hypothetical protein
MSGNSRHRGLAGTAARQGGHRHGERRRAAAVGSAPRRPGVRVWRAPDAEPAALRHRAAQAIALLGDAACTLRRCRRAAASGAGPDLALHLAAARTCKAGDDGRR